MRRKGQSISINTIIVAAVAVLVLVVVSVIFMGKMGQTRIQMDKCESAGGRCVYDRYGECVNLPYHTLREDLLCNLDGDSNYNEGDHIDGVCCIKVS
mgnify:CR=1 FL=1